MPLLFSGCASHAKRPETAADAPPVRAFSKEEIQNGRQINSEVLSSFYLYTDPRVVAYVNDIGQSLLGKGRDPDKNPYQFTILYNDRIYAVSAPGGFIYVTTGLINLLDNEAELAAVLAQEISLLQFQDPRVSGSKKAFDGITNGVAMVGPMFGQIGMLAVLGVVALHAATDGHKSGSEDERMKKMDELAMRYMVAAGYDPQGYIDLLHKFIRLDPQALPYFFDYYQTHPITEERFLKLNQTFEKLPLTGKTFNVDRGEFLETTKGIREMYKG
jgi:predicted Zn-dependent protease